MNGKRSHLMCCLIFVAEMMYAKLPMQSPISPSLANTFARPRHLYDLSG